MNKKKFTKLSLTAETLRNLSEPDLKKAVGGVTENTVVCTACTNRCSICCL